MSRYLFLLPIANCKRYLLRQLGNSYKSLLALLLTFATYLMYIVHLISIDLQLSRLFNSPILYPYNKDSSANNNFRNNTYKLIFKGIKS
jgi:hypothetical protein